MAKYFGIDYGLERTGSAISDPDGKIAFPFRTFRLKDYKNRDALLLAIAESAKAEGVDGLVIGMPFFPDGGENEMCAIVRNFAKRLQKRIEMPVSFVSETFTSEEAERDLRECGIKSARMKKVLDQQAACRILQDFLDMHAGSDSP